jgi:heme-degrading monooxygenase HmoA
MANATQGTGDPITMITTFTLTGERDEFEAAFTDQAELLSASDGFIRGQVGRSLRRPGTYVNFCQWRDPAAHLAAVRSRTFFITYAILKELAQASADQAAPVLGSSQPQPASDADLAESAAVALTLFDLKEGVGGEQFEQRFAAHARFMRAQDGFVAHSLVRSLRRPGRYANIGWWRDPAAYLAVMQSAEFRADARSMSALVDVEGDLFEVLASLFSAAAQSVPAL